ncbi:MAG: hypothetical protein Q9182_002782 [Xanthomendoza sp. 2 TL-2023]
MVHKSVIGEKCGLTQRARAQSRQSPADHASLFNPHRNLHSSNLTSLPFHDEYNFHLELEYPFGLQYELPSSSVLAVITATLAHARASNLEARMPREGYRTMEQVNLATGSMNIRLISLLPIVSLSSAIKRPCINNLSYDPTAKAPGRTSLIYDTDPAFVYNSSTCTSTNQKIIPPTWANDCGATINTICGSTADYPPLGGPAVPTVSWSWAWHTAQGSTCQAGLYQSADAGAVHGPGFLSETCCQDAFGKMVQGLRDGSIAVAHGNRLSINIAPGGFPHTVAKNENGTMVNADGKQVDARVSLLYSLGDG